MALLEDTDFLLSKREIVDKIKSLLSGVRTELQDAVSQNLLLANWEISTGSGKISQGENYLGLPYLVLDFPAQFEGQDIFAYRTMFWWGHFFSCTLHLQGKFWDFDHQPFLQKLKEQAGQTFICVNETPWEYHYGPDNYLPLDEVDLALTKDLPFLKASRKFALQDWSDLPALALDFWALCVSFLRAGAIRHNPYDEIS